MHVVPLTDRGQECLVYSAIERVHSSKHLLWPEILQYLFFWQYKFCKTKVLRRKLMSWTENFHSPNFLFPGLLTPANLLVRFLPWFCWDVNSARLVQPCYWFQVLLLSIIWMRISPSSIIPNTFPWVPSQHDEVLRLYNPYNFWNLLIIYIIQLKLNLRNYQLKY